MSTREQRAMGRAADLTEKPPPPSSFFFFFQKVFSPFPPPALMLPDPIQGIEARLDQIAFISSLFFPSPFDSFFLPYSVSM